MLGETGGGSPTAFPAQDSSRAPYLYAAANTTVNCHIGRSTVSAAFGSRTVQQSGDIEPAFLGIHGGSGCGRYRRRSGGPKTESQTRSAAAQFGPRRFAAEATRRARATCAAEQGLRRTSKPWASSRARVAVAGRQDHRQPGMPRPHARRARSGAARAARSRSWARGRVWPSARRCRSARPGRAPRSRGRCRDPAATGPPRRPPTRRRWSRRACGRGPTGCSSGRRAGRRSRSRRRTPGGRSWRAGCRRPSSYGRR